MCIGAICGCVMLYIFIVTLHITHFLLYITLVAENMLIVGVVGHDLIFLTALINVELFVMPQS